MAKIETIKDAFDTLANRGQSQYFSSAKIMEALDLAQLDLFNKEHKKFEQTQQISDLLRPFYHYETITVTSGLGNTPSDFHRFVSMSVSSGGAPTNVNVELVKQQDWYNKMNDVVEPPTAEYPICRHRVREGGGSDPQGVQVEPASITQVRLEYLSRPETPVYAFTLSGDSRSEIYDAGSSTDIEWDETAIPELIRGTAGYLGIALKDEALVQLEQLKPETT